MAADEILIPIQCEYYALEGVSQLLRTINLVKGSMNDHLYLSTVCSPCTTDAPGSRHRWPTRCVSTSHTRRSAAVIPRSVRVSEAPSYGQTVLTYHSASAGAQAYLDAAPRSPSVAPTPA